MGGWRMESTGPITFTLEQADLRALAAHAAGRIWRSDAFKRLVALSAFMVACWLVLVLFLETRTQRLWASTFMALVCVLPYAALYLASQRLRRRTADAKFLALIGSVTVEIAPEGLKRTDGTGSGVVAWRAVEDVTSTVSHAFVRVTSSSGPRPYMVVPARAFGSGDAFQAFVAELRAASIEGGGGPARAQPRTPAPRTFRGWTRRVR